MTIAEQLTEIYYTHEPWHESWMKPQEAIDYHKARYENGDIHVYQENGEVLGYYERYFLFNACMLYNVWIREDCRNSRVTKELKRHFFSTLPKNINVIIGYKVKLGGKKVKALITKERHNGSN